MSSEAKALEEINNYKELLTEVHDLGDDVEEDLLEEVQDGIRFDGIPLKNISDKIAKELESLTDLKSLSFANCKLSSLEKLPKLPTLEMIDLSDNNLKGDELAKVVALCPNLQAIAFGGNSIKTIDELKHLVGLKSLSQLDLFNNAVANLEDYRDKVFKILPQLKVLDLKDSEGNDFMGDEEFADGEEEEYEDDEFIDHEDEAGKPSKKIKGAAVEPEFEDVDGDEELGEEEEEDA